MMKKPIIDLLLKRCSLGLQSVFLLLFYDFFIFLNFVNISFDQLPFLHNLVKKMHIEDIQPSLHNIADNCFINILIFYEKLVNRISI